ncbi:MAG: hypothetical protein NXH82_01250 [Rhodobacteraceae bacterium]|nr:hypothetical protein [Paracoccaceae bacterium]
MMLPDHFHGVWTLRAGQSGFAPRWSAMRNAIGDYDPALYAKIPPAHEIWCHEIRCDADYRACIQYCWEDPVRHSLARAPDDWAYTSFAGQARATA